MTEVRGSPIRLPIEDRLWQLSSDLMCVAETTGVLVTVNNAWTSTLGWTEQELAGSDIRMFVYPDDVPATEAELTSLAGGARTLRFEIRLLRKEGGYRYISWRSAPADGLIFAVGRDITERIEREEALRQSQKMEAIGQLAGGIAHDFNNLLTILRSSVELLQKPDTPVDRRQRYIEAMRTTIERAARLTNQLLAFARRQKLEPEVFDVSERIADICQLLRPLIGDGVQIYTRAPSAPCFVETDICQFENALMNLAINARDAMNGCGEIHVTVGVVSSTPRIRGHAAACGEFVAISVKDSGPGIPPQMHDKVFEPFFTTKQAGQGTGLGLSQVYGFVKQSGGNIAIDPPAGSGAVFTIFLPRSPHTPLILESTAVRNDPAAADSLRVLLVEDNEEVGSFCAGLLNDLGHRPSWTRNASEALALLRSGAGAFDIVFSDIVMPGMSGLDLAEHLQAEHPELPVVLTSGYSQALADGGTRGFKLVSKPYSPDEISAALHDAVRSARRDGAASRRPLEAR
jgi:PAS domain S-box-containing protein